MFVWDIDPVLVRLGPLSIRYYGLCFLVALLGGYFFWRRQIVRSGRSLDAAERFVTPAVIAVIGGARLGHVIFYEPGRYFTHPWEVLYVWQGGLASHGATVGLILTAIWYARAQKMSFWEVADRFSFSAAWGAAWVRVGNFMNSEIVGRVTDVSWGVKFPRYDDPGGTLPVEAIPLRHPSQLYEFALGVAVLGLLLLADRVWGEKNRPRGGLIFLFFVAYFGGRFFVEYAKEFQTLNPAVSPLTMGQYLSIPFALFGIGGLAWTLLRKKETPR